MEQEPSMTSYQLANFCELLMVNDPWPLDKNAYQRLTDFANDRAHEYGFVDWIEAYHKLIN